MTINWSLAQQLAVNGVVAGSLFALLGLSWNVIYATTRVFHFAHALVFVVAAYATVVLVGEHGVPLLAGLTAGIAVGAVAGAAVEVLVYRPLRRAQGTALTLFLASMGLFIAGVNVVQLVFGPRNRSLGDVPNHQFFVGDVAFSALDVSVVVVAWAAVATVAAWERRTRWGRALSAVRTNPMLASAVGVDVPRMFAVAFMVGSALVAIAALYVTATNVANPAMGAAPIISGLIAMFLGGIGKTVGVAIGGLVLGLSQSMGGLVLPGQYQVTVSFVILLVVLLVKPQGLFGERPR